MNISPSNIFLKMILFQSYGQSSKVSWVEQKSLRRRMGLNSAACCQGVHVANC